MPWENVYCVCEGRTQDGKTKCRKRITQGKGSSAKNQAENIRATRDADYKYKEGDVLHVNCLRKLEIYDGLNAGQTSCLQACEAGLIGGEQQLRLIHGGPGAGKTFLASRAIRFVELLGGTCGGSSSSSSSSSFLLLLLLQKSPHVS